MKQSDTENRTTERASDFDMTSGALASQSRSSLILAGPEMWRSAVEQLINTNPNLDITERMNSDPRSLESDHIPERDMVLIAVNGADPEMAMNFADGYQIRHPGTSLVLVLPNMSETYLRQYHDRHAHWSLISAGACGDQSSLNSVLESASKGIPWTDPIITSVVQSFGPEVEISNSSRILITDDNNDVRLALQILLEDLGYEVMEAGDGEEAVGLARAFKPNLILLDVMMPKMDGFTALGLIKSDSETKDIPVIMVTARRGMSDEQTARGLGAFDYLHKPWADGEVEMIVNWALSRQRSAA